MIVPLYCYLYSSNCLFRFHHRNRNYRWYSYIATTGKTQIVLARTASRRTIPTLMHVNGHTRHSPLPCFTPLSFRRSLPPVNAVRQLLPCWFASQAHPSYLSARWILPTIPARDAPFLLIAHCPPTLYSHMPRSYMPRPFTPLPSPGFFGTAPYLCCAARPTYVPTLPSLPELRP